MNFSHFFVRKNIPLILLFGVVSTLSVAACTSMAMGFEDAKTPPPLTLKGISKQSAAIVGKTSPNADIEVGDVKFKADKDGDFVIGIDRDEKSPLVINITSGNHKLTKSIEIAPRKYDVTEVKGLPPATINPPPEAQAKIDADRLIKNAAWASMDYDQKGFAEDWQWPLKNIRITSNWGAVRSLNGTPGRPHYGIDLGAAKGTPIYAPASGKIVIAESDLYYEGGLVGIDHGQGFISYTMHMSKVDVKAGQLIKKGDKVGEVGSTGRSTGPHLHWSLRWHGKQVDPSNMVKPQLPIQ